MTHCRRGTPSCQEPGCRRDAVSLTDHTYCRQHGSPGETRRNAGRYPERATRRPEQPVGTAVDDFTFYFGCSCGSSRKTLRKMEEPNVMVSYATKANYALRPVGYGTDEWSQLVNQQESTFLDSGGFQILQTGGTYDDTVREYLDHIAGRSASIPATVTQQIDLFALRDYPITEATRRHVDSRARESATEAAIRRSVELTLETMNGFDDHEVDAQPVAVLQGETVEDYIDCFDQLRYHGADTEMLAIGSVKPRSLDRTRAIITSLRNRIPDDYELHGMGITTRDLEDDAILGALDSADSNRWVNATRQSMLRGETAPPLRDDEANSPWQDNALVYLQTRRTLRQLLHDHDAYETTGSAVGYDDDQTVAAD